MEFLKEEAQSEDEIREDIFRLALERIGTKKENEALNSRLKKGSSDHRRRRFVQEGQVIVERQALTRTANRPVSGTLDEQQDEISRLRALLRQEQRRAEEALKEVNELKNQYRTLETHVVHDKLHMKELTVSVERYQKNLQEAQLTIRRIEVEKHDLSRRLELSLLNASKVKKVTAAASRPKKLRSAYEDKSQKPVRWWKD